MVHLEYFLSHQERNIIYWYFINIYPWDLLWSDYRQLFLIMDLCQSNFQLLLGWDDQLHDFSIMDLQWRICNAVIFLDFSLFAFIIEYLRDYGINHFIDIFEIHLIIFILSLLSFWGIFALWFDPYYITNLYYSEEWTGPQIIQIDTLNNSFGMYTRFFLWFTA